MSNSITPNVDYIILCDSVSNSPDGKKTLYGLFDTIRSKGFPCVHSNFSMLVRLINGMGKHKLQVQILDPNDKPVFKTSKTMEIKLDNPLVGADLVMQFQGFVFKVPGPYRIEVILDGRLIEEKTKSFQLEQV